MVELGLGRLSEVASRVGLKRGDPAFRNGQDVFAAAERIEQEPSNALIFDFASKNLEDFLKRELGSAYMRKELRYVIAGVVEKLTNRDKAFEVMLNINHFATLGWGATERLKTHGEGVQSTRKELRRRLGYKDNFDLELIPLEDVMRLNPIKDALGNHGIVAYLDINAMIILLSKTDNQIDKEYVNISFQSGAEFLAIQKELDPVTNQKIRVSPPKIVVRGAFVPENAERNLRDISRLPLVYPQIGFFMAGGNHGDVLTHPDIVPQNAFFVVECDREGKPVNKVYGFPLGVFNGEFGTFDGSSQSTVIAMEVCRLFALKHSMRGDPKAVVDAVRETCAERHEYKVPKIDHRTYMQIPGEFDTHEIYVLQYAKVEKELAA